MFLEYLSLALLITCITMVFYAFLYIHELPYEAAVHRNHPQQEAIYVACWLSLFTLHAIWPLVWIWAVSREGGGLAPALGKDNQPTSAGHTAPAGQATPTQADLLARLARLEAQLASLQSNQPPKEA